MKVLVTEPLAEAGLDRVRQQHDLDLRLGLSPVDLCAILPEYDALIVRSETKVTREVVNAGARLKVIARAGVGVDNIDVPAATARGIAVVNSPEGNTIAATEHTLALILSLARSIPQAAASLSNGEWKRSRFVGVELYHKTLGILGFGKIGREVARRALGFEMRVLAYDPFVLPEHAQRLGVQLVEKDELLQRSDFVTIHLPLNAGTRHSISETEFALVRPGFRLVNCARGGIVDEDALLSALESGRVAGAALDVFEKEPPGKESALLRHPRIIATPHLGASTEEAQVGVAVDVAEQVNEILAGRPARSAVNLPGISPEILAQLRPYLILQEKMGRLAAALLRGRVRSVRITYIGEAARYQMAPLTRSFLMGLLQPALEEAINLVNAALVAEQRGVTVTEGAERGAPGDLGAYNNLITIEVAGDGMTRSLAGAVIGKGDVRIVSIDNYSVDIIPEGVMLITMHTDKPGMIGKVGSLLGSRQINIARMQLGRAAPRGRAVMVLNVDDPVSNEVLAELLALDGMQSTTLVEF
ncbi:MAG TPA: phosphoglycerate dehydrogenase [Armatimonadota bacterium]|nr:phosphoglycerate dehydrogenase [Armatimonadota bacterium]